MDDTARSFSFKDGETIHKKDSYDRYNDFSDRFIHRNMHTEKKTVSICSIEATVVIIKMRLTMSFAFLAK